MFRAHLARTLKSKIQELGRYVVCNVYFSVLHMFTLYHHAFCMQISVHTLHNRRIRYSAYVTVSHNNNFHAFVYTESRCRYTDILYFGWKLCLASIKINNIHIYEHRSVQRSICILVIYSDRNHDSCDWCTEYGTQRMESLIEK